MAKVLLVVTSGIAAYKCPDLVRQLVKSGHQVRCVLTKDAHQFVSPLALATVSTDRVFQDLFDLTDELEIGHIRLARDADVILVAPATANFIAMTAHGLSDDLASTVMLAADGPVMMAPAMNPFMYQNPATQQNIRTLESRGVRIIGPDQGDMACGENGAGRMVEPEDIVASLHAFLAERAGPRPLAGLRALVTSGPTYEAIDPVRFVGNRSSGKQGHALARALAAAGADVTLVSGPTNEPDPDNVRTIRIQSALQMLDACHQALPADIAIFAAAVADWRPANLADQKMKKVEGQDRLALEFIQNPDILKTISSLPREDRPRLVIGFAAETEQVIAHARQKRLRKGCDWIVANDVSGDQVFGHDRNRVTLIQADADADAVAWPEMTKDEVAYALVRKIAKTLGQANG